MRARRLMGAALAVVSLTAWPANATFVVEGTWGAAWRVYECTSGSTEWSCSYYFDTWTDAGGEQCREVSVATEGGQEHQLDCHAVLTEVTLSVQWRLNAGGRKVGCLSSATEQGRMGYTSATPGLSHRAIPVTVSVHDGLVRVTGNYRPDGAVPPRRYLVEATFRAGCTPGGWAMGDADSAGVVEIDG